MEAKQLKIIRDLYVKLNKYYNTCFITSTGYIISAESDIGRNSVLKLTDEYLLLIKELVGSPFKVIKIDSIKDSKDTLETSFEEVTKESTISTIFRFIDYVNNLVSESTEWYDFRFSDDENEHQELVTHFFVNNESIDFNPKGTGSNIVILTKAFLPLVTEKNYQDVTYSSLELNDGLNVILFKFNFTHFTATLAHHYVRL